MSGTPCLAIVIMLPVPMQPLADNANSVLASLKGLCGSSLVNAAIRRTLFAHFCAGAWQASADLVMCCWVLSLAAQYSTGRC